VRHFNLREHPNDERRRICIWFRRAHLERKRGDKWKQRRERHRRHLQWRLGLQWRLRQHVRRQRERELQRHIRRELRRHIRR
jgi:hypothetical protein